MAFSLRNRQAILRDMVAQLVQIAPEITDYTAGAIARSVLETLATQLGKEDRAIFEGLREAIVVACYKAFQFSRLPASYASGFERFYGSVIVPEVIPAGTQVQIPGGTVYTTTASGVLLPSSGYVDIPVISSVLGSAGNAAADAISSLVDPGIVSFVTGVTNLLPFNNGQDQESDTARFQRFQNFIAGLSRGIAFAIRAAAAACYIADAEGNATERVVTALVVEPWQGNGPVGTGHGTPPTSIIVGGPVGNVFVYVDDGAATASDALVDLVYNTVEGYISGSGALIPGYVAAGVRLMVFAVVPFPVAISAAVSIAPGYSASAVLAAVQSAIGDYIGSLEVNQELVINEVITAALNVAGTTDIAMATPLVNITPPVGSRVTLSSLTIIQM
jgi:uncharacterized phage protein gp47/JayE